MEGLLFLLFLAIALVYFSVIKNRKTILKRVDFYNQDIAKKIKMLVDNQIQLHDMLQEIKDESFDENSELDNIDKIITDIELANLKNKTSNKQNELNELELLNIQNIDNEIDNTDNEEVNYTHETLLTNEETEEEEEEEIEEELELTENKNVTNRIKTDENLHQRKDYFKQKIADTKSNFKNQFPDLEKFIGENLINKIGIVITVIGIIFSVKYAIDNEYINEFGRVFIGILAGGLLIGVAHRLRAKYEAFSSVLVGGGLATLYFTIGLAFQDYQIFSQSVAFAIMLIITIFAVLLSILYNRQELAVLAIIGGFATPLAVSTGEGNYIVLFSYLALLNVGMLVLAYFKKWRVVNIVSYFFTVILFSAWLVDTVYKDKLPLKGAFIFAGLFYLIFFFQNIVYNLRKNTKFQAWEFFILLSNSFAFFAAGLYILHHSAPEWKGIFTAIIAFFNFIFAFSLYKKSEIDKNLVFLLIGLVLSFVSLIAPIQLKGNYITLFWATESVILLWMWQKTEIKLIRLASVAIIGIMLISLSMDWNKIYFQYSEKDSIMQVIANKGFITGFAVLASLLFSIFLLKKEKTDFFIFKIPKLYYYIALSTLFTAILYLTLFFEIAYHLKIYYTHFDEMNAIITAYNLGFIMLLSLWLHRYKNYITDNISITLNIIGLLIFAIYALPIFAELSNLRIEENPVAGSAIGFHYISLIIILFLMAYNIFKVQKLNIENKKINDLNYWISTIYIIAIFSAEIDNIVLFKYFDIHSLKLLENAEKIEYWQISELKDKILQQSHKIAFPVLWGISSFVLMLIGLSKEMRVLRIIALAVFFITILKLFVIDVWDMAEGGRILAFVLLGVLLLIISFLYQKIKLIILEKDEN